MTHAPVKNIIFDLGGVILNIDHRLTHEAFKDHGIDNFLEYFSKSAQYPVFDQFETGQIQPSAFRAWINEHFERSLEEHHFDAAWNALLLDIPNARLELLKKLKLRYRTFLLSNTNKTHILSLNKYLKTQFALETLEPLFEKVYYSYEMGMRKPGVEIYEQVLRLSNLEPRETLFIDDSPANIEGAQRAGLQTLHLAKGAELCDALSSYL